MKFDADLLSLRNAVHQFGYVTTLQCLSDDALMSWPSAPPESNTEHRVILSAGGCCLFLGIVISAVA